MTKITKDQAQSILNRYSDREPEYIQELNKRIRAANRDYSIGFRDSRSKFIQKCFKEISLLGKDDINKAKTILKEFMKSYGEGKTWYPYVSGMPGKLNGYDFAILKAALSYF